ncbi:MAG TPA: hypothetical protein PKE27_14490 [Povalibacter sp.]|uniref:hypothetical protein n=1 Tax=Povalibacter sp. TaxID=1962978 RepID=UPI002CC9095F|nr:hypothetical protein [Povalibacter sp.]HMN45783.1 hypothetical protein [Povalibacter sp.]
MGALLATITIHGALAADLDWPPVDAAALDDLRGGFEIVNGLKASFGVERAAYVNGELVAKHSVNIPDIAAMTPEQASALNEAINSVVLIQNGPNNSFDVSNAAPGSTIIQNTLNDQHIVTLTTINADVASLAVLRDVAAQESLQLALNRVTGAR